MNIIDSISLFAIMVTLATIPSTSVALVITRSATLGVANGIAVATGIVLGDLIFVLLAVLGLSVVAETLGGLFLAIKYLGGAYLIWMGITLLRSGNKTTFPVNQHHGFSSLVSSFLAGLFLTLGDVKAIFFYISLFPVFIDISSITAPDIGVIVFVTIAAVGGVKIGYAIAAREIATLSPRLIRGKGTRRVAGGFLIGAGSWMIAKT